MPAEPVQFRSQAAVAQLATQGRLLFGIGVFCKQDYGAAKNLAGQCPDCGNLLVFQEGCFICPACGYTKC